MNRDVCEHFNPVDLPCDKCKPPTALRLADALQQQAVWEGHYGPSYLRDLLPGAAAELRRLHAELERCRKACAATSECWRADADRWTAQRDALLEALKYHQEQTRPIQRTIDAIKAAEENT